MVLRRLLFTGATGFLGRCILPRLAESYECVGIGGTRAHPCGGRVDLTDLTAVESAVCRIAPNVVIHAAALADVDACERDPAAAWRANVVATANLVRALEAAGGGARLVLISTDQVYDGTGPHTEEQPNPVNVYGLTKLWAEDWVLRARRALVLRTNFIGLDSDMRIGFAGWLAEALTQGKAITLFDDVLFNPLHVAHLADLMVELIEAGASGRLNLGAGDGGISKAAFGVRLAEALGLSIASARIGSVDDVPLAARRPHDMRMATARVEAVLGRVPETVDAAISRFAAEWRGRGGNETVVGRA